MLVRPVLDQTDGSTSSAVEIWFHADEHNMMSAAAGQLMLTG